MKREIKFRGKSIRTGGWVYGGYGKTNFDTVMLVDYNQYAGFSENTVDTDTVGQFTGLQDVDGTEIYEGDIVFMSDCRYSNVRDKDFTGRVVWDKNMAGFVIKDDGEDEYNDFHDFKTIKVVGNIHDGDDEYDE